MRTKQTGHNDEISVNGSDDMNHESCIQTIELLRELALNIHGVIDAVDDRNCNDIIAMLKEQEAKPVDLYGNEEWWGLVCICPDCKAEWMTDKANTHYCPRCGRSVKWE